LTEKVDGIRWKIEELDNQILDLVKKRMEAALAMGRTKVEKALPVRDMRVEDQVVARYCQRASEVGISEDAAAEIAQILIRESVEAQARLPRPMGAERKVLVIGGAGRMGLWFARYMAMRGHHVQVHDVRATKEFPMVKDLTGAIRKAEVVIVAVPISEADKVMRQVIGSQPTGLVFDIMSVKGPVVPALREGVEEGVMVCSVHPMFGPDALSMYSRNIIVCDCGSHRAVAEFKNLVDGMGAKVTEMMVEDHDQLISLVLGLSHAVNISFFSTLKESGVDFNTLEAISSTTFKRQVAISRKVSLESPHLYYEIQHENPHTARCLEMFEMVVNQLRLAATADEDTAFVKLMEEGKRYFGED
jgi:chorismate mutase/prephenate dehydrogenase